MSRKSSKEIEGRRRAIRFLLRFALFAALFFLFVTWSWADEHLGRPFTLAIVRASALLMRAVGFDAAAAGTTLTWRGASVSVYNGCNAVEALGILWAAVLAFPAGARSRLFAIGVGTVGIQLINLFRVASLLVASALTPGLFGILHEAAWPAVIILLTVGFWLAWSLRELAHRKTEAA